LRQPDTGTLRYLDQRYVIAVGDVHGCDQALAALLEVLLPLKQRVVFLGDYVDRGPDSIRVVELLIAAKAARPDWVFLLGNHEIMLRENLELRIPPIGENTAYDQYAAIGGVPTEHQAFFDSLRLYYESERFTFVHAGPDPETDPHIPIGERAAEELCWSYRVHPEWRGKTIVRGHVVVREPKQHANHVDLDTGCYQGGWLTAGVLDDKAGALVGAVQISFDGRRVQNWRAV
jgi:serine/threonine protein phosphatase 1